jgi:hypothetical protein
MVGWSILKIAAQRLECAYGLAGHCAWCAAQDVRGLLDTEITEEAEREHVALTSA